MRINTNIAAMNTHRQLQEVNNQMEQSLERLSSGQRINRAADDAAGLAISEQMRGQISGLNQASENAQDATSLIQTAEGALNESHEILQRMRELAVQSANDTLTESDRAEIQEEVNELSEELSRIGYTTEFNTQELLDGSMQAEEDQNIFHIGANENQNISLNVGNMRGAALNVSQDVTLDEPTTTLDDIGDDDAEIDATALEEDVGIAFIKDENFESGEYEIDVDEDQNVIEVTVGDDGDGPHVETVVDALNAHEQASQLAEFSTEDDSRVEAAAGDTNEEVFDAYNLENPQGVSNLDAGEYTLDADNNLVDQNDRVVAEYNEDTGVFTDAITGEELFQLAELDYEGDDAVTDLDALDDDSGSIDPDLVQLEMAGREEDVSINWEGDGDVDGINVDVVGSEINVVMDAGEAHEIEDIIGAIRDHEEASGMVEINAFGDTSLTVDPQDATTETTELNDPTPQLGLLEDHIEEEGNLRVEGIDVSEQEAADDAISIIDNAIETVSSQRSELGALQNRLDHTVANLGVASENLSAAESRIRDVDMADEMMNFQRTQILEEAGTAMMAQANMAPQSVLQLLG